MLPVVTLDRNYRIDCTTGVLSLPSSLRLCTLERAWVNNAQNISCIPAGSYYCRWIERSASGKYKRTWHVEAVEGRTGILIHPANLVTQLRGCIALGMKYGNLGGKFALLSSLSALNKLRSELSGQDFILNIN